MTIYRILIVEDDLDMQEMIVSFLQKSGFMVSAVKNAVELSDQLKSQRIDLVLLDLVCDVELKQVIDAPNFLLLEALLKSLLEDA